MSGTALYDRRGGVSLRLLDSSRSSDAYLLEDETELVQRGGTGEQNVNGQSATDYALAPVRPGDTLMMIALRYGCKVAHLKQLNHMFGDQEVFGRRTIRVPIKRHGIIEELISKEMKAYETTTGDAAISVTELNSHDEDSDRESVGDASDRLVNVDLRRPLLRRISSSETGNSQGQQATQYLHNLDSDVKEVVSAFAALRASNDAIGASVTCRRVRPDRQTSSWGLDCGIRWSTAIILMVVIGIIVPVFFFVKYKFFHEKS